MIDRPRRADLSMLPAPQGRRKVAEQGVAKS
jgi:hypothetical protein